MLEGVVGDLRIADQMAHLLMKRGQVLLDRKQVVTSLLDDFDGNLTLVAHRIYDEMRRCRLALASKTTITEELQCQ